MTTITDPGGTPSVIYNRGGMTIDSIVPAGSSQATATPIVAYAGHTVVIADNPMGGGLPVRLPDNAETGDVVEIHWHVDASIVEIYPQSGGRINGGTTDAPISSATTHTVLRKTSATDWYTTSKF